MIGHKNVTQHSDMMEHDLNWSGPFGIPVVGRNSEGYIVKTRKVLALVTMPLHMLSLVGWILDNIMISIPHEFVPWAVVEIFCFIYLQYKIT